MTAGAGWEYFETEADVGVRAWGRDRAEALAQVALGVLGLVVSPDQVEPRETREVQAQGDSPEALLVNWVNECLYVHEIEGFLAHRVEVDEVREGFVHGRLQGEEWDRTRHEPGTLVKAATHHQAEVRQEPSGRVEVRLIVDV